MLYSKWWKNTGDVCNRDDKNKDSKANALGVENIGKERRILFFCCGFFVFSSVVVSLLWFVCYGLFVVGV